MFEVGTQTAVFHDDGAFVFGESDVPVAQGSHRLDSDGYAGVQDWASAGHTVVGDVGRLVNGVANAVADQLADDAQVVFFQLVLDGGADVADTGAFTLDGGDAGVQGSFGAVNQALDASRGVAAGDHTDGGVVNHAFISKRQVKFDEIALADRLVTGNAVDDGVVDGDADDIREAFIALDDRLEAVFFNLRGGVGGKIFRGNARYGFASQIFENFGQQFAAGTHVGQVGWRFGSHSATPNARRMSLAISSMPPSALISCTGTPWLFR